MNAKITNTNSDSNRCPNESLKSYRYNIQRPIETESPTMEDDMDDPVPLSGFGLKGNKDRALRYVLRRLDFPMDSYFFSTVMLAKIWLARLHSRWEFLHPDVKVRLVADLLDSLYRTEEGFDVLFEILFHGPDQSGELRTDYSSTAADILRSFGLEHTFLLVGQFQNVLDFPLKDAVRIHDPDGPHLHPSVHACVRPCLCHIIGRPLYVAFFFGRPDMVRILLNCGASLMPAESCSIDNLTFHPLSLAVTTVFTNGDGSRRQRDLLSLQFLLVDAPQGLRRQLRSAFVDAVEEIPSLKHAARACVRRHLRASRTIGRPGALWPCGLPKCLEAYIYMEDVVIDAASVARWRENTEPLNFFAPI